MIDSEMKAEGMMLLTASVSQPDANLDIPCISRLAHFSSTFCGYLYVIRLPPSYKALT